MADKPLALITGASAGIGLEFARQLAERGFDLILVARREQRLREIATELRRDYATTAHVIVADLSQAADVAALVESVTEEHAHLALLINNAGFGSRGAYREGDLERQLAMVDLNVKAVMSLCHTLVPLLTGGGAIINVASLAAFQAGPYMATYYATKAFVLSFSEALHEEYKRHGVSVQALCPGPTESDFGGVAGIEELAAWKYGRMDTDKVVRASLDDLDEAIVIPGISNRLLGHVNKVLPRAISRRIAGWVQR